MPGTVLCGRPSGPPTVFERTPRKMRTGWKVGIALAVVALVGAGIVASVALADGGSSSSAPAPAPAPQTLTIGTNTTKAFSALMTCATANGLDAVVADALDGSVSLSEAASALTALGACEDEARALVAAVGQDVKSPGETVRGVVQDTAACLDGKGVTLSGIASALLGDKAGATSLQNAAEACLPQLSSLTR